MGKTYLKVILLCTCFIVCRPAWGQIGSLTRVTTPHSPDASALGKFVEIPVGHYNGIPSIQVPLYELQLNGIRVPISLSYHASGLKVKDIPGMVGAGWALNAGGVINRVVRGYPDDHDPYLPGTGDTDHYDAQIRSRIRNAKETGFNTVFSAGERYNMAASTPGVFSEEAADLGYEIRTDTEYDLFYFNFNGHVGQFTFNNDNQPILLTGNDLKVEYTDRKFKVTDAQGIEFYFDSLEQSMDEGTPIRYYAEGRLYTTSWFVSKIRNPVSGEEVIFSYKSYRNSELYDQSQNAKYAYGVAFSNWVDKLQYNGVRYGFPAPGAADPCPLYDQQSISTMVHHFANALFPDEITWRDKTIKFYGNLNRIDLYKYKIDSIQVISGTEVLQRIHLHHGYFNAGATHRKHRKLKLDSVTVAGGRYRFSYIESVYGLGTPPIDSRGQDFWGYYNGEDENLMLGGNYADNWYSRYQYTPYYKIFDTHPDPNIPFYIPYRNSTYKNPDAKYGQLGVLSSVTYPTGGRTEFTYEGNTYSYTPFTGSYTIETDPFTQLKLQNQYSKQCRALYVIDHVGTPDWNGIRNFVVHQDQQVSVTGAVGLEGGVTYSQYLDYVLSSYPLAILKLQKYNDLTGQFEDVESYEVDPADIIGNPIDEYDYENKKQDGATILSHNRYLTAGQYRIFCEVTGPGTVAQMNIGLKFDFKTPNGVYRAGGLRIKDIEFIPGSAGEEAFSKSYSYTDGTLSSGVLESPFANIGRSYYYGKLHQETVFGQFYSWQYVCEFFNFFSEPLIPLGNSRGGIIGYSKVTESREDGARTVYSFTSGRDGSSFIDEFLENNILSTRTRVITDNSWRRGLRKQVDHYRADDFLLEKTVYGYEYAEDTQNKSVSVVLDHVSLGSGGSYAADVHYIERYPQKALVKLDSTIRYTADGYIYTATSYEYNTPWHYYPAKITQRNSGGDYTVTHYRYPQDFNPVGNPTDPFRQGIRRLLENHVVSPVVERYTETFRTGQTGLAALSGELVAFRVDRPLPSTVYRLKIPPGSTIAPYTPVDITASVASIDSRYRQHGEYTLYDPKGNVREYKLVNGPATTYLWGYEGQYLVAEIRNATYEDLWTVVEQAVVEGIEDMDVSDSFIRNITGQIGLGLKKSEVTAYTYKPLVGLTSQTDASGRTVYYEYDALGRLTTVRDQDGFILETYCYNYAGQHIPCP